MTDYRNLCIELFGTDDVNKIRKIARKKHSGRRNKLNDKDIEKALTMQKDGKTIEEIAKHFGVSRQTMSEHLNKGFPDYSLRIDYTTLRPTLILVYLCLQIQTIILWKQKFLIA